ncbi:hypothetical protein FXB39_03510 [Nocardioides sp. BGMRC 2183]|nr:hypothetical protein FXB39_03510 [Nocardioides sp. BGMRC 2183]
MSNGGRPDRTLAVAAATTAFALLGGGLQAAAGGSPAAADLAPRTAVAALPAAVESVAAGARHSCALTSAGRVWCWGANDRGQLGRDDVESSASPVLVEGVAGVVSVVAGETHTCARTPGEVWCWGANGSGQLGDGTTQDRHLPVRSLAAGVTRVAAGRAHTCAVADAGSHEVQLLTVSASGGSYRLSDGSSSTPALAWNAGPAVVEAALDALSGNWDVSVRRDETSQGLLVDFDGGSAAHRDVDALAVDDEALRGVAAEAGITVLTEGGWRLLCWGSDAAGQLGRGAIGDAEIGGSAGDTDVDAIATDPVTGAFFLADTSESRIWEFTDTGHFLRLHRALGYQPGAIGVARLREGTTGDRAKLFVVDASGDSATPGAVHRYDVAAMSPEAVYDPADDPRVVPPEWTCHCTTTAMAVDPADGTVVLVYAGSAGPTSSTEPYAPFAKLVRVAPGLSGSVGPNPVDLVDGFPGTAEITDVAAGSDRSGTPIVYALQRPSTGVPGGWRIGVWDIGGNSLALRASFPVDPAVRGADDGSYDGACPVRRVTEPRQVGSRLRREVHLADYGFGEIGPAGDGDVGVITRYSYRVQEQVFEPGEDPVTDAGEWVDDGPVTLSPPQDACITVFAAGSQGGYGRFVASLRGEESNGSALGAAPTDLTWTTAGRLLVADPQHERVQQFAKVDRRPVLRWPGSQYTAIPTGSSLLAQVLANEAVAVSSVSAGDAHTCISTDKFGAPGPVLCWGSNAAGQLDMSDRQPWVPFRDPAETDARTSFPVVATDPGANGADVLAAAVTAGGASTCASDTGGASTGTLVVCWGEDSEGQLGAPASERGALVATSRQHRLLDSGGTGTCLTVLDAALECWGPDVLDIEAVASASVSALSVGGRHACAVVDSVVRCWGENGWGQTGPSGTGDATAVTVPLTPRVVAQPPKGLGAPITVRFDDLAGGVTDEALRLTDADGAAVPTTTRCRGVTDEPVACTSGTVRSVLLSPRGGVVAGEAYRIEVDPDAGLLAGGEPVSTADPLEVDAPRVLDDRDLGQVYRWGQTRSKQAYGHQVLRESAPGATASFDFTGRAVVWYTRRGPSEGVATIAIDGRVRRTVDNSARRDRHRVAVRVAGLSPGRHTITVGVEGRRGTRARGRMVTIDAFAVGRRLVRNPSVRTDWGVWRRAGVTWSRGSTVGSSLSVRFRGRQIVWHTVAGPHQGSAALLLDGVRVETFDGLAARYRRRSVVIPADPGVHRLTIRVLGSTRRAPSYVAVDGFEVSP